MRPVWLTASGVYSDDKGRKQGQSAEVFSYQSGKPSLQIFSEIRLDFGTSGQVG